MTELIPHNCPVDGPMMIEEGKPCNWCNKFDNKEEKTMDRNDSGQTKRTNGRGLNCDQVAWLLDIAERHLPKQINPAVCQQREMQKYAMLYEIMEVADLRFEDDSARWNGTPNQARDYGSEDILNAPGGK